MNSLSGTARLLRSVVLIAATGMLFANGCSSSQIQAVLTGVGAAADDLSRSNRFDNRNLDLGDFLPPVLTRL